MKNENKILIMGGNGFIGKNIIHYFKEKGIETDVYDLFPAPNGIKSYQGNILTDDHLEEIIAQYDTIIYLITSVSPKKSMDFPELSYTQDMPMLLRTLDCCIKGNTKRVIFASSGGTVYGECSGPSNDEEDTKEQPINHYAICKLASEKVLQLYNKLYEMENIVLRIANPYGVGQNPMSGVGAVTTFAKKMLNNETVVLYGDGSTSRDFIHIEAVAQAFYKAYNWDFDKTIMPVFNIGSGQDITLKRIIEVLSEELEIEPQIEYLPDRNFDVKRNVLNIEKARKYLQYEPGENEEEHIKEYVKRLKEEQTRRS